MPSEKTIFFIIQKNFTSRLIIKAAKYLDSIIFHTKKNSGLNLGPSTILVFESNITLHEIIQVTLVISLEVMLFEHENANNVYHIIYIFFFMHFLLFIFYNLQAFKKYT